MDVQGVSVFERAYQAWDAQDWPVAATLLEEAARAADGVEAYRLWFDAALAHKFLRDWPRAFELGRTAAGLAQRGVQDPAFWNLGIAATALHEWETARDAWLGYGIELKSTEGEVLENFGMTPVRLDPEGRSEVVWAQRICPTRAVVRSIPVRAHRTFGDVILHDGAPNGSRTVNGRSFSVFDEIAVWKPSGIPTWTVRIEADAAGTQDLLELFARTELGAEPASSLQPICKCCSSGDVEQHEPHAEAADGQEFWLAAPQEATFSLLHLWQSGDTDRRGYRDVTLIEVGDER
jgi:hypothetical protein